ncbi:adenylate cyclase [Candidatus Woesearchaeota archaeon CG10_big_fil_rev_8_21_14_0_10_44_13]|nr:MAG: adenylate cyclase [Candidatus Woesearchaeota archaeon CG10_big_fil_rev_8_21_14_0_10_44_13]
MPTEHETKVLDIDVNEIEGKLRRLGAKEEKEVTMRRWVFDMNPKGREWIRLRDNGKNVTLAYKKKSGSGISDTEEIETEIGDFDKAYDLLSKINFKARYYRESKRRMFRLKGMEFTIDTWPKVPALLEIEAESEKRVREGLRLLGLGGKDIGNMCMIDVYKKYGIDVDSMEEMRF